MTSLATPHQQTEWLFTKMYYIERKDLPTIDQAQNVQRAVESLSEHDTQVAVLKALEANSDIHSIIVNGLVAGLKAVGEKWMKQKMYNSHVLMAAKAVKAGQDALERKLAPLGIRRGLIVLGTAQGDLHDVGKSLAGMMLRLDGWDVRDIGTEATPRMFMEKAKEVNADLIGISIVMGIYLDKIQQVCSLVRSEGIRAKVIIGGPGSNDAVARKVNAHTYAGCDTLGSLQAAKRLLDRTKNVRARTRHI